MPNNFLVFDENGTNMLSDGDYQNSSYRLNGAISGIAPSPAHNKLFRQTSIMCAAFGEFMSNLGYTVSDTNFQALLDVITAVFTPTPEPTGVIKGYLGTNPPDGYVLADGGTIGSAASGATNRANNDTQSLYTLIWGSTLNDQCPIQDSNGNTTTRGASAAADFAANKRLPLPDYRGRVLMGLDNMGGTAANRVTSVSTGGENANKMMGTGGAQANTLTSSHIPSLTGTTSSAGGHVHAHRGRNGQGNGAYGLFESSGSAVQAGKSNSTFDISPAMSSAGDHTHTITVNAGGGNSQVSNTAPWSAANIIIKL